MDSLAKEMFCAYRFYVRPPLLMLSKIKVRLPESLCLGAGMTYVSITREPRILLGRYAS